MTLHDDALTSSDPMPGESSPDDDVTVFVEIVAPLSGATMTLPRATLAGPWLDERPIGEVVVTALDEHTQPPA